MTVSRKIKENSLIFLALRSKNKIVDRFLMKTESESFEFVENFLISFAEAAMAIEKECQHEEIRRISTLKIKNAQNFRAELPLLWKAPLFLSELLRGNSLSILF